MASSPMQHDTDVCIVCLVVAQAQQVQQKADVRSILRRLLSQARNAFCQSVLQLQP
jgi:hypothetical protein